MESESELERLKQEIAGADAAVRNAEKAIGEYLAVHPNAHAIRINGGGIIVKLGAMTADLQLTALERVRDEAKERFARALNESANLKKKLQPEEVYIGGIKQP